MGVTLCVQNRNERVGVAPLGLQRRSISLVAITPTRKDLKRENDCFRRVLHLLDTVGHERVGVLLVLRL